MAPKVSRRSSPLVHVACLALAALALSGCVIAPYPYHHWGPRYHYY